MSTSPTLYAADNQVFCLFCFQDTAQISLTKKGLPTLHCRYCGTRVFWHSAIAVRGFLKMVPKAIQAVQGTVAEETEERYGRLRDAYGALTERAVAKRGGVLADDDT